MSAKEKKKPPKQEIIQAKTAKKKKKTSAEKSRRSVIVHKSQKPAADLYQMLAQVEDTIAELSRIYADLPDSRHYGVGGRMKPSLKQEMIAEQIRHAHLRAARLIKLMEKSYPE